MSAETRVLRDEAAQLKLTLLLGLTIFFSVLNGVMFNVAVPDIAAEFALLPSEVSWVVTAYISLFALGSVTYGKLADRYPVRNLITVGLTVLNLGSLAGFLSANYPLLIGARLLQASGGAAIPALSMLAATRYFPPEMRGRVLGIIAATVALAMGVGPILGGFVAKSLGWRYLFPITLVTALTIPFFRRSLPREPLCPVEFDLRGLLLLGGAVVSLLVFITQAVWWLAPAALAFLWGFAVHIRRRAYPFVPPALLANGAYRNTLLAAFLAMGTVFGMTFMTPIMLRALHGLDAQQIGLVLFPGAMSGALLGRSGGKLVDRRGNRPVVFGGLTLLGLGFVGLSTVAGLAPPVIASVLVVCYIGFAFSQASLTHTISTTLSPVDMGIGMGIYNLLFFMSGAFASALLGRLLDLRVSALSLNPLLIRPQAALYSNLFLLLCAAVVSAAFVFRLTVASDSGVGGRPR